MTLGLDDSEKLSHTRFQGAKKCIFHLKMHMLKKSFIHNVKHTVRYLCMKFEQARVNIFRKDELKPFWGKKQRFLPKN